MLLAGDIGGTKTTLILFSVQGSSLKPIFRARMGTRDFPSPVELVQRFLVCASEDRIVVRDLQMASFACAGAVVEDRVVTNNLPWVIESASLSKALNLEPDRTLLLNDLVSADANLPHLPADDSTRSRRSSAPAFSVAAHSTGDLFHQDKTSDLRDRILPLGAAFTIHPPVAVAPLVRVFAGYTL